MSSKLMIKDAEAVKALAEHLSQCEEVVKFNQGEDSEAWTLAHSFQDIEESCRALLDDLLPRLTEGQSSESEIQELLHGIGEEFRHILYHIKDTKFYQYLYE
jgi:hypothetical protein